jgi:hypothetical protein
MESIYNYFFGVAEIKIDEKVKHQRHLVLKQIKDHKIKLKPINPPKKSYLAKSSKSSSISWKVPIIY